MNMYIYVYYTYLLYIYVLWSFRQNVLRDLMTYTIVVLESRIRGSTFWILLGSGNYSGDMRLPLFQQVYHAAYKAFRLCSGQVEPSEKIASLRRPTKEHTCRFRGLSK